MMSEPGQVGLKGFTGDLNPIKKIAVNPLNRENHGSDISKSR